MKRNILIFLTIAVISCSQSKEQNKSTDRRQEEFRVDTKLLESLHDSLNHTGDILYYQKYRVKLDEMIKKYPDRKGLKMVKKQMEEIFKYDTPLDTIIKSN